MDSLEFNSSAKDMAGDVANDGLSADRHIEIPPTHVENTNELGQKMSLEEALEKISGNEFEKNIEQNPGYAQEWNDLAGNPDTKQDFSRTYSDYLLNPETLKENSPEKYEFMKEHVFNGKEFLPDQNTESVNSEGSLQSTRNVISFSGSYKYCTPSSCSGWASDGEYVNC